MNEFTGNGAREAARLDAANKAAREADPRLFEAPEPPTIQEMQKVEHVTAEQSVVETPVFIRPEDPTAVVEPFTVNEEIEKMMKEADAEAAAYAEREAGTNLPLQTIKPLGDTFSPFERNNQKNEWRKVGEGPVENISDDQKAA